MNRLSGVEAVSFDVDGTLWDFQAVMRRSLQEALLELERLDSEAAAALDVERMIDIRDRVHDELRGTVTDLAAIRKEAFRQTLIAVGRPDDALASQLNDVFFRHRFCDLRPYEGAVPVLEALEARYTLGVISNGNTRPGNLGIEGRFKFSVYAQDCGVEKPDPRIFALALERAHCSPRELVHVGDSLENDVAGAKGVGARGIWLNRDGRVPASSIEPDLELSSLRELLEIL